MNMVPRVLLSHITQSTLSEPGHPPDVHGAQVLLVHGLLYEPVRMALHAQRQAGHRVNADIDALQAACLGPRPDSDATASGPGRRHDHDSIME